MANERKWCLSVARVITRNGFDWTDLQFSLAKAEAVRCRDWCRMGTESLYQSLESE